MTRESSQRRTVITGLGVVSPLGSTVDSFWDGIVNGRSGAVTIDRFDTTDFKTKFACQVQGFELPTDEPRKFRHLDPFSQYALIAGLQAAESSGLDVSQENTHRLGVITGSGIGGLTTIEANYQSFIDRGARRISPFMIPMMMINAASGHIAIHLGYQGPNYTTSSACASSQHAFGSAIDQIRKGICDAVLVGGTEATITPLGIGGFNSLKALSTRNDDPTRASRPFSESRDGFVMGEGAAMFLFEELEHAQKRGANIMAEVCGFGMTDDSGHITAPLPEGDMAIVAMQNACADGGVPLDAIDYINAHGTSTKLNDVMETKAIRALFGDHANNLMVSSTKSQIGHLLGASGAVELAAVVLGLHHGVVPPTINYDDPDPECDLDYVPNEARESKIDYALSNSFGFGGHNASLCVGRFK